jgi:ABC-2 type transport system ATP-binding protein
LDGTTLVTLERGDDQAVLQAALATGPVHEFGERRPTLTELSGTW